MSAGPRQFGFGGTRDPTMAIREAAVGRFFKKVSWAVTGFGFYTMYLFFKVPDRGFILTPCIDLDPITMKNIQPRCETLGNWYNKLEQKAEEGFLKRDFSQKDDFLREMSQVLQLTDDELAQKIPAATVELMKKKKVDDKTAEGSKEAPQQKMKNSSSDVSPEMTVATALFAKCAPLARYYLMFDVLDNLANRYESSLGAGSKAPPLAREGRAATRMCSVAYSLDHVVSGNQVDSVVRCRVADAIDSTRTKMDIFRNGQSCANDLIATPIVDAKGVTRVVVFEDKAIKQAMVLCVGSNSLKEWALTNVDVRKVNLSPVYHNSNMAKRGFVHKRFNEMFESCWEDPKFPEHLKNGDWDVTVIGHSMGGALAQVFASALAHSGEERQVNAYSVASPRVFTIGAARAYEELHNLNSVRVFNQNDWAPMLPSTMRNFEHAGTPLPIYLPKKVSNNLTVFFLEGFKLWHGKDMYKQALLESVFIQTSFIGEPPAKYMSKYL